MSAPLPENESNRLRVLKDLHILDTDPEEAFDEIADLARSIFDVEKGAVSFVAEERQWFKAACGWEVSGSARGHAFCSHAILKDRVMVVEDAEEDDRFDANPFVIQEEGLRFYAGAPITVEDGYRVGTLCVADSEPRSFSKEERSILARLASRVERELVIRQERHRIGYLSSAVEEAGEIVLITEAEPLADSGPRIVYANPAFTAVTGYPRSEAIGQTPRMLHGPETSGEVLDEVRQALEAREPVEVELLSYRQDGTAYWLEMNVRPVVTEKGTCTHFVAIGRDTTERKTADRRRTQIIRRVTDAIVEVDSNWRFTLLNDQAEELYDMKEENLLGKRFWEVFEQALGTRFEEEYRKVMRTREPTRFEEYYSGLDGWFDIQVYPNDDGGIAFYFTEITERKDREEQLRLLDQLIQHDLRGDVTNAQGWAEMLEQGTDPRKAARRIQGATGHMLELLDATDALQKALRSGQTMEQDAVDLGWAIDQAVQTCERRFPEACIRTEQSSSRPIYVWANELLGSVFENLIANGIRHNDQETPEVQIRVDEREARLAVVIADNGPGIPPARRERIFDEKRRGLESTGLGLGLYLVKTLIDDYGGQVKVTDREPRGTEFTVRLPKAEGDAR